MEYPILKPLELHKQDIPKGKLREYLLASDACFPAFQAKEIDGKKYIDGGYHDNMPVNLALEMGAQRVIAVDLESIGIMHRIRAKQQQVIQIYSLWPLGSFLKFDGELARKNIQLGYLDTQMQERTLLLYLEQLELSVSRLRGEIREKCRLSTVLGVMGSLFLVIVML